MNPGYRFGYFTSGGLVHQTRGYTPRPDHIEWYEPWCGAPANARHITTQVLIVTCMECLARFSR